MGSHWVCWEAGHIRAAWLDTYHPSSAREPIEWQENPVAHLWFSSDYGTKHKLSTRAGWLSIPSVDIEANRQFLSFRLSLQPTLKSEENPSDCPIPWRHSGPRVETHIFQLVISKSVTGDKPRRGLSWNMKEVMLQFQGWPAGGSTYLEMTPLPTSETRQEAEHLINWPMNKSYF